MSSFFSQIMEPGGGVMLLPFVRLVIGCLLCLTVAAAIAGVARIHMIILSVLSSGLLLSLQFFESEFKKARRLNERGSSSTTTSGGQGQSNKTD
jgi:predicted lipid-binding transport protein (Tim44 family)